MKTWLSFNWLKILAILAAAGTVMLEKYVTLPYFYYQLMNWAVVMASLVIIWQANRQKKYAWGWLFALVAIIFNPIAPIYLNQDIWRIADLVVAGIFVISFFFIRPAKVNGK